MDTLCFSHLRWDFVYQRPQHLLKRFSQTGRVFYIEEAFDTHASSYYEIHHDKEHPNLWIVHLYVSPGETMQKNAQWQTLLCLLLEAFHVSDFISWYYTPMALAYTKRLIPKLIVYDCMDELSAFKFAPAELRELEKKLFEKADIVFVGGASLYQAKKRCHPNVYLFPSSIDKTHFEKARIPQDEPADQAPIPHPRFGFYGVLDERLHISLIAEAAALRPDWQFILIGPVVKIDPGLLPAKDNIHYPGKKNYGDLPAYLAGWDVAILPFALNESTRFISPTKTPEYLAGGVPVISTSIADVVDPYQKNGLVKIADTAAQFVAAGDELLKGYDKSSWLQRIDRFLKDYSWDRTYFQMKNLIDNALMDKHSTRLEKTIIYV